MRYFIAFAYFGKSYHGWQNQPNAITVQQVLEKALSTLLRQPVALVAAGRTDAGVHARELVAHFDFKSIPNTEEIVYRVNALLPEDIAVSAIFKVSENAHARFDALERTYEYWIVQKKNPFAIDNALYIHHMLDIEKMNKATTILMEYTDFECFSKSKTDVHTYLCDIKRAKWEQREDLLVFSITANRFLRNMVRAIVGTLLDIGLGKSDLENLRAIITSKNRSLAGTSVPAKGLYLTKIVYPDNSIK